MKQITILFFVLFILVSNLSKSQSLFQKKADQLYNELAYIEAIDYYKNLVKSDSPSEMNMRRLAECHFKIYDFKNAETAYKNLLAKFNVNASEDDLINYLQCLKYNENYSEADNVLKLIETKRKENIILKNHNKKKLYYKELKEDSVNYLIKNVDQINTEYSEFSPVFFKNNKMMMYASNRRNTSAKNKTFAWDDSYFIDMYTSNKIDSLKFKPSVAMAKKISGNYHDGPAGLSSDEKTIYITKSNTLEKTIKGKKVNIINLKLYIYTKDSLGNLSNPISFPYNSDDYSLGHASLTKDGKRIYFVSDMPGGFGQTDLYYSEYKNGAWDKPINLGPAINTEGREMFPTVFEDGTLFFSTDGRAGLGGLDLYFAVPEMDLYFEPQNLGYPLNSNFDDFGLSLNTDFKTGYLSSNRPGGKGKDDIYYFRSKEPLLKVTLQGITYDENTKDVISNARVFLMDENLNILDSTLSNEKGEYSFYIKDSNAKYKIGAKKRPIYYDRLMDVPPLTSQNNKLDIGLFPKYKMVCTVKDLKTGELLQGVKSTFVDNKTKKETVYSTDMNGKFEGIIKGKKVGDTLDLSIKFEKEGYITVEKNFNIILDENTIVDLKESIQKLEIGADIAKVIEVKPIYFDLAKWNIRPDAAKELDKIVKVMNENPTMTIELGSHTDCRSSKTSNLSLSDKRAKASAAYIVSKGIDKNRIVGKGYGESKLINGCACEGPVKSTCSEEEHQANRRTEFIITKF
jgi:outer membrane protein OmpA-like peptidoglycan-associated protein